MLYELPFDIHYEILKYLSFKLARSINNYCKQIADKIELNNIKPLIVNKSTYINNHFYGIKEPINAVKDKTLIKMKEIFILI